MGLLLLYVYALKVDCQHVIHRNWVLDLETDEVKPNWLASGRKEENVLQWEKSKKKVLTPDVREKVKKFTSIYEGFWKREKIKWE